MKFLKFKKEKLFVFFALLIFSFFAFKKPFSFFKKGGDYYFFQSSFFNPLFHPTWALEGNFLVSYFSFIPVEAKVFAQKERETIEEYIVQEGETLSSIAEKFNISLETILEANQIERGTRLKPGQKLIILPYSGLLHLVKKGETLESIAKYYKIKKEDILFLNEEIKGEIVAGDILFIPLTDFPKKEKKAFVSGKEIPLICPIAFPCRKTQGLHFFNAVDLSNGQCGENVFAAQSGVVQKIGFDKRAGNYIRILHDQNVVTFYGHLSKIYVNEGQRVNQGEIIGLTGRTGLATGCHLHFEVRGAKNPF